MWESRTLIYSKQVIDNLKRLLKVRTISLEFFNMKFYENLYPFDLKVQLPLDKWNPQGTEENSST